MKLLFHSSTKYSFRDVHLPLRTRSLPRPGLPAASFLFKIFSLKPDRVQGLSFDRIGSSNVSYCVLLAVLWQQFTGIAAGIQHSSLPLTCCLFREYRIAELYEWKWEVSGSVNWGVPPIIHGARAQRPDSRAFEMRAPARSHIDLCLHTKSEGNHI